MTPRTSLFMQDVKVLDLSRHLPGPMATLLMVDMGASVTKIEAPGGDEVRTLGPKDSAGRPVFFDTLSAGKELLRIDLKSAQGTQQFLELVRNADVVVESFRPGVLQRLGLGYATLSKVNKGIIVCALNGFGSGGPWRDRAGHDLNYLALAGVLNRNRAGGAPLPFEPPLADSSASLFAVIAVLGALRARARDGMGCEIDVALGDAAMPLQMLQIAEMRAGGEDPQPSGLFTGGAAYYASYETLDGRYMALGAVEPKFWSAFCSAAGHEEWIARQAEPLPQTRLHAEVAGFFKSLSMAECEARFADADCCLAPVLTLQESLATEHVRMRKLVRPGPSGGLQALLPLHVNGEPPALRGSVAGE